MRHLLIILLFCQLAHADPAAQAQKALKGLTSPSLEKRLDANAVLEGLEPEKIKKNGALVSALIGALSQAALREKDRFRPGDYARCLMRYAGVSSNQEKDLTSILPLLSHSSSEVVLYSWAGVGEWARRPLKQPVVDKLLAFLDHPREQVRINALMWLCRRADIQSAMEAGKPLNALQQSTWQRLLTAAQQSQSLRLSTAALRFLIQYADIDRVKVLAILGGYLTRGEIDEEDLITYQQLDRWIDKLGLEATVLAEPLAQAAPLFQKRKLADLQLCWRATLGPWSASERNLVKQLVQEADFDESNARVAANLVQGLAEHGPDGRADMLVLAGRLAKESWFRNDPLFLDALARTGVDAASTADCLKAFSLQPDAEHSGLLAAVGASGSKDPLLQKELLTHLGSPDETVQLAAAYSLACLGGPSQPLHQWIDAALKAGRYQGLLLGTIRRSQYKPVLPSNFPVTTGETLLLKHMAGQADPSWAQFLGYLQEGIYPLRCWRASRLADKEATLASLDLLLADPPKFFQEPLALKLLMGSADPDLAGAAARCYQTLWKP